MARIASDYSFLDCDSGSGFNWSVNIEVTVMDRLFSKIRALNLPEPIGVVGMGISGLAALEILRKAGYNAIGFDEKKVAPDIQKVNLDDNLFADFATLVVSPGIDRRRRSFQQTHAMVINDVEIFARVVEKPVAAVTGSNGKSTIVTLLAKALKALGHKVCLCGNIGRSVIEAMLEVYDDVDYYVIELSSYQLEICPSLAPKVGAIINITPDHLDRYDSFADYGNAKASLAKQSQIAVLNADDAHCLEIAKSLPASILFGRQAGEANRVGREDIFIDNQAVLRLSELTLHGRHNYSNVLCVLLMMRALGEAIELALASIKAFSGLEHRMRKVREFNGVCWINDSKATNIGATAAALYGVKQPVVLIAGGLGKGQDFNELVAVIKQAKVKQVLLIGLDNTALISALTQGKIPFQDCTNLDKAVKEAAIIAQPGDWVLLSPACASFDQFEDYEHRGCYFSEKVAQL